MTRVTLGSDGTGQSHAWVEIKTPFALAKLVVDPDVRVFQVRRKLAERKP